MDGHSERLGTTHTINSAAEHSGMHGMQTKTHVRLKRMPISHSGTRGMQTKTHVTLKRMPISMRQHKTCPQFYSRPVLQAINRQTFNLQTNDERNGITKLSVSALLAQTIASMIDAYNCTQMNLCFI